MAEFFASGQETCRAAFPDRTLPKISYGLRFPEACLRHVEALGYSRVYLIASKSIAANTDAVKRLQDALGAKLVGTRVGINSHTPISEVLEVVHEVIRLGDIDCLITLGAGSLTDGAKLVRFAVANDATTAEEVDTLWGGQSSNPALRADRKLPTMGLICIPTSLSGGEYQHMAGATEAKTHAKRSFHPGRQSHARHSGSRTLPHDTSMGLAEHRHPRCRPLRGDPLFLAKQRDRRC